MKEKDQFVDKQGFLLSTDLTSNCTLLQEGCMKLNVDNSFTG